MNTLLQYSLSIHCLLIVICRVDCESNEKRIRSKHKRQHASSFANSKKHKCKSNDDKELIFELRWRNAILANAIQRAHYYKNKPGVDTVISLFAQCPRCLSCFSS